MTYRFKFWQKGDTKFQRKDIEARDVGQAWIEFYNTTPNVVQASCVSNAMFVSTSKLHKPEDYYA